MSGCAWMPHTAQNFRLVALAPFVQKIQVVQEVGTNAKLISFSGCH